MKPKVRAREISLRKTPGLISKERRCLPISGVGKSISTSRWKPEWGNKLAPALAFLDS